MAGANGYGGETIIVLYGLFTVFSYELRVGADLCVRPKHRLRWYDSRMLFAMNAPLSTVLNFKF